MVSWIDDKETGVESMSVKVSVATLEAIR